MRLVEYTVVVDMDEVDKDVDTVLDEIHGLFCADPNELDGKCPIVGSSAIPWPNNEVPE